MAPDQASPGTRVFLDTGYLVALEDADDDNHAAAREHREGLRRMPVLTTTSYVLDETVTFFNVRGRPGKAVELGEMLLSSCSVRIVHLGEALLRRGLERLRRRPDERYSLTDCVSFVLMRERGLTVAYSFDRHFEQEGFVRESRTEGRRDGDPMKVGYARPSKKDQDLQRPEHGRAGHGRGEGGVVARHLGSYLGLGCGNAGCRGAARPLAPTQPRTTAHYATYPPPLPLLRLFQKALFGHWFSIHR